MKCPFCGSTENEVLESRVVEEGNAIRRRRSCSKCSKRFTTFERISKNILLVVKKDGKREAFDSEKLRRGVLRAVSKRPVTLMTVDDTVRFVEQEMMKRESREIPSQIIGRAVLKRLKKIDRVAWLRYASVYLEFEDLADFEELIEKNTQ